MRTVASVLGLLLSARLIQGGFAPAEEPVEYVRQIKPMLASRCASCHGNLKQQSGLRLDTASLALRGGEGGPAIVPGKSADSLLFQAVTGKNGLTRMPLDGEPLTDAQISLLARWIDEGAKAPDEPVPPDPRRHWAFQPPIRPLPPTVRNSGWVRNPIDAFVAAEHEKRGLTPRPEAARHVLLRRLYLDLVGLPPTRDELRAFLADTSPNAYEKVVDALLESPRYGERWGRHWMDVWRYSDWAGYGEEIRESQRHIWRWRDWTIESLNQDKPYDRMIVEMLAGDEAAPGDPDTLRATGFLARNWFKFNRNIWLDNTIEHTSKAFLGITLNCARCHDHKYDPISQADYYRFRAIFEPYDVRTDRVPGQADMLQDGLPRVFDANAAVLTYLFVRGNDQHPDQEHPLPPGVPAALGKAQLDIQTVALRPAEFYPALRPFVQQELLAQAAAEVDKAKAALIAANQTVAEARKTQADLAASGTTDPAPLAAVAQSESATVLAMKKLATAEANQVSTAARIAADNARYAALPAANAQPPDANAESLAQAAAKAQNQAALCKAEEELTEAEGKLAEAQRAVKPEVEATKQAVTAAEARLKESQTKLDAARAGLAATTNQYAPLDTVYPAASTGRRLALARWIADRRNPLAARAAVNQMWLRHFGEAIVPSVFDLGLNGKPASHPLLLDWLAVEFMDHGWSMKAVHRLMVTANAYRMDSGTSGESNPNLAIDRDNRYLWHMRSRRMEAEVVRDSVLHVAGQLDTTMGGAEIDQNAGQTSRRRSVYFRHAPEKQMTFLKLFDGPSVVECYRRDESIAPQQALALANSPLALDQSRLLAAELSQETGEAATAASPSVFVAAAFEQVLCRPPTPAEQVACEEFLLKQAVELGIPDKLTAFAAGPAASVKPSGDPHQRARENLVHVLLNHNDFVTIR